MSSYTTIGDNASTTQSDNEDRQTIDVPKQAETSELWDRFWTALADVAKPKYVNHFDQKVIGKAIGVGQTMVSAIKTGKKRPSLKAAEKMADYAEMSMVFLLQGKGPQRPWSDMDSEFKSLIQFWETLDDSNRGKLLDRADELFKLQQAPREPRFPPPVQIAKKAIKKPSH